jgi:RHS repeat-associated protein
MTNRLEPGCRRIKAIIAAVLSLYLLASAASAADPWNIKPDAVPTNIKEKGAYETSLYSGAFAYSYPIDVPPGTGGLAPSLSLAYNSQEAVRRGWVGSGWRLGDNYVQRDLNRTLGDDKDDMYQLFLDGARYDLVFASSDGLYHTDPETYLVVDNRSGALNRKGGYWIVRSKEGSTYEFGYNSDSELIRQLPNTTVAMTWSLDLARDSHNNSIYYSYDNTSVASTGLTYPKRIEYNNDRSRAVAFDLEPDPNPIRTYEGGVLVNRSKRLKSVTVSYNGSLVRSIRLNYSDNMLKTVALLASIQVCGTDNITCLPKTEFTYNIPQPGWNGTYYPLPCKTSEGCYFANLNGDAYPDMIVANASARYSWVSDGTILVPDLRWIPPVTINFQNESGWGIIDVNGDGKDDLFSASGAYLNNGTGWGTVMNVWWAGGCDFKSANECRFIDLNNDGLVDVISTGALGRHAWVNNASGYWQYDGWAPPYPVAFNWSQNWSVLDLNGDGNADLAGPGQNMLNTGTGFVWQNSTWPNPCGYKTADMCRYGDLNGDGFPDIIQAKDPSTRHVWLNNGTAWAQNDTWAAATTFDSNTYLQDVNADGLPDIEGLLRNGTAPYALASVKTSLGGTINVSYLKAEGFNASSTETSLGYPMWLVSSVSASGGMGYSPVTEDYDYEGGLHDYVSKEFRGFASVRAAKADGSATVTHFFQDDARKGLVHESYVLDASGALYSMAVNTYATNKTKGVYNPLLLRAESYAYDGKTTPKIVATDYEYDNWGGVVKSSVYGDSSYSGDERYAYTEYVNNSIKNDLSPILVKPKHRFQLAADNVSKVSESFYRYDGGAYGSAPTKGDLTWAEEWLNTGVNTVTTYGYDTYGNQVNVTDPLGRVTRFVYGLADKTYTFPEQVINPLNQTTNVSYLPATGDVNQTVDPNGYKNRFVYDVFGRLSSVIREGDSVSLPSVQYAYFVNGSAPSGVRTRARVNSGSSATFDSVVFVDGLGRQVQSRTDAEPAGKQVVSNTFYDSNGRLLAESMPYFVAYGNYSQPDYSVRNISHVYDAVGREIRAYNPEGTNRTTTYNQWNITYTDENGHNISHTKDAYGRIAAVYEYNGGIPFKTVYGYDGLDELVNITDNEGNIFRFEFDSLGRMTGLRDPDLGNWSYGFDAVGEMVNQTDARGVKITFEYDGLGRLTRKDYSSDVDTVLTYDQGKVGVLSVANSSAGIVRYDYDSRLRLTSENFSRGLSSWRIQHSYDALDREVNLTQSNGEVLSYTYNGGGMLDSIPSYITGLDYSALGKVSNRTYANGLVSLLDYYSTDFRLKSIRTGVLQGVNYTYDSAGNVLSMHDYVNGSRWQYGYDFLNRLTVASENGVVNQSYAYTSIGNLVLANNGSAYTNYSYGVSAGPHAVTSYSSASYYFNPANFTASCSGVSPSLGSDWNITANTTCSNGLIRLSENKTVFVAASKSLSMENLVLEPSGVQSAGFILVDNDSVFEIAANTTVYGDDVSSANLTNSVSLVYDANGNMINDSRLTFVYNDENRMKRVYNGSNLVEEYIYDHSGNRKVKLTVLSPSLNKTTYYLSQAWIREEYTNGTARDSLYVYANNELLARKDSAGDKHYYHPDHLGSTVVVTKPDGSLEEHVTYEPWGLPRQQSDELFQYTSQEWEQALGFYDYNARQYSPFLRRFLQADIKIQNFYDPQGVNRYSYVRNNPLRYVDPTGLDYKETQVYASYEDYEWQRDAYFYEHPEMSEAMKHESFAQMMASRKKDPNGKCFVRDKNGQVIDLEHKHKNSAAVMYVFAQRYQHFKSLGYPKSIARFMAKRDADDILNFIGVIIETKQYGEEIWELRWLQQGYSGYSPEDLPSNKAGRFEGLLNPSEEIPLDYEPEFERQVSQYIKNWKHIRHYSNGAFWGKIKKPENKEESDK